MGILRRLFDSIDVVLTGRPPRIIDRRFGWLRELGFEVTESGQRAGMTLYTTYVSKKVAVGVEYDYHYDVVDVYLARRAAVGTPSTYVRFDRVLKVRASIARSSFFDPSVGDTPEQKLNEAAQLLRQHCADLLRGDNLELLDEIGRQLAGTRTDPATL